MIINILSFLAKHKILTIIGVLLFIFSLVFINLGSQKEPKKSIEPPLVFKNQAEAAPYFPSYINTRINKTTEQEISSYPNRKDRRDLSNGYAQYFFPSGDLSKDNTVITKNNVAVFKNAISVLPNSWEHPDVSVYIAQYGKPDAEFVGSVAYGRFAKTLIYATGGFAVIFNPSTNEVFEIQSFLPTTVEQYLESWGSDIKNYKEEVPADSIEPL